MFSHHSNRLYIQIWREKNMIMKLLITSRQTTIRAGFRRLAFTKPINDKGKANIKQVNTLLRLPVGRSSHFTIK